MGSVGWDPSVRALLDSLIGVGRCSPGTGRKAVGEPMGLSSSRCGLKEKGLAVR